MTELQMEPVKPKIIRPRKKTPQQKLAMVLDLKNTIFKNYRYHGLRRKTLFFSRSDKTQLLTWPIEIAEKVIKQMLKEIKNSSGPINQLSPDVCPYCYRYNTNQANDCSITLACDWGRAHGNCILDGHNYFYNCHDSYLKERCPNEDKITYEQIRDILEGPCRAKKSN